jgi:hypothetical protein
MSARSSGRSRSLWPREHGAYFQLAIPSVTACLRSLTAPMLALAIAAALAFLAHEPLLVVLGHRGPRPKEIDGPRARVRLGVLVGGALVLGVLGLVLAPPTTLLAAAIVAGPIALLLALAWRRAEHTLAGELVAAVALTGASVPVRVAGEASLGQALEIWLGWAVGFGASVVAVHRVIARHKRSASWIDHALVLGLLATTVAGIELGVRPLTIAAPLTALAAIVVLAPPPASRLRTIGVAIVAAAMGASAIVLA